jgi:hypothetical protein
MKQVLGDGRSRKVLVKECQFGGKRNVCASNAQSNKNKKEAIKV